MIDLGYLADKTARHISLRNAYPMFKQQFFNWLQETFENYMDWVAAISPT
jgi:hypothetical protein